MYYDTIDKEREFLSELYKVFGDWVHQMTPNAETGTNVIESDILCPKCNSGKLLHYGIVEPYGKTVAFSMKHVCSECGEVFDKTLIDEDIYNHTPHEYIYSFGTPFGSFCVLRNNEPLRFRYSRVNESVKGHDLIVHLFDVDTSFMNKGDKIFAGIPGADLEYKDSDERCFFMAAQSQEQYMAVRFEDINDYEVNIDDSLFVTDQWNNEGCYYLIHQEPEQLSYMRSRHYRVISFAVAWENKTICKDYEDVIDMAVW